MSRPRHLTFANVASAVALAIAVAGGGVAAAAGLAANSVGSAQIKTGAVKSADVKNNNLKGKDVKDDSLTGNDVNESTLSTVPSVAKLTFGAKVTAAVGQTVPVSSRGPLSITLTCTDNGGGDVGFDLTMTTSVNGAAMDANVSGGDFDVLNVGDLGNIADDSGTGPAVEHVGFSSLTPTGEQWQGYGMATSKFGGSAGCSAELVFIG